MLGRVQNPLAAARTQQFRRKRRTIFLVFLPLLRTAFFGVIEPVTGELDDTPSFTRHPRRHRYSLRACTHVAPHNEGHVRGRDVEGRDVRRNALATFVNLNFPVSAANTLLKDTQGKYWFVRILLRRSGYCVGKLFESLLGRIENEPGERNNGT